MNEMAMVAECMECGYIEIKRCVHFGVVVKGAACPRCKSRDVVFDAYLCTFVSADKLACPVKGDGENANDAKRG